MSFPSPYDQGTFSDQRSYTRLFLRNTSKTAADSRISVCRPGLPQGFLPFAGSVWLWIVKGWRRSLGQPVLDSSQDAGVGKLSCGCAPQCSLVCAQVSCYPLLFEFSPKTMFLKYLWEACAPEKENNWERLLISLSTSAEKMFQRTAAKEYFNHSTPFTKVKIATKFSENFSFTTI